VNPGHHGVHQDLGRTAADAAVGEVEDRLVVVGAGAGEGLGEEPQTTREGQNVGAHEGEGRRCDPAQLPVAKDEAVGRPFVGLDQGVFETPDAGELEGIGGVVEKSLRPPFDGEAGIDLGADLAARPIRRLEDHGVIDPVVVLEPGGGGETGDAAADDGDPGLQFDVSVGFAAVKSASSVAAAVTPVTMDASSGRKVGVWR